MFDSILCGRALAFVLTAGIAITAGAAGQRSFVASNGNDVNPCTRAQPCRGFAAAVANTAPEGEVIVLDSAGYGAVTITKSITIASPAGVYAGITVFGGDGVTVNGANAVVVLRGLSITWQGGTNGISFVQGSKLLVQDCEIGGRFNQGIIASAANGQITVRNTTMREANYGFYAINSVQATLDNVRVYDNGYGVFADTGSKVSVANSVLANNGSRGATAVASGGGTTELTVARSVITRCVQGLVASATAGSNAYVLSDGNTITDIVINAFAFFNQGGTEVIYTPGNNAAGFATTSNGTLTPCCAI